MRHFMTRLLSTTRLRDDLSLKRYLSITHYFHYMGPAVRTCSVIIIIMKMMLIHVCKMHNIYNFIIHEFFLLWLKIISFNVSFSLRFQIIVERSVLSID